MLILAVGLFLHDEPRADTRPAGRCGSGWSSPASASGRRSRVFTALVQNSVDAAAASAVATASLTFFQQIGGTIGLTIAGTILADSLTKELPSRLDGQRRAAADRRPVQAQAAAAAQALDLTGTGDLGAQILAARAGGSSGRSSQPFIPRSSRRSTRRSRSRSRRRSGSASSRRCVAALLVLFLPEKSFSEMTEGAREGASPDDREGEPATPESDPARAPMDLVPSSTPLAAGTYTRAGFEPAVTFEIGAADAGRWTAVQSFEGFFDVQQGVGTPDVIAVQFARVVAVVGADAAAMPASRGGGCRCRARSEPRPRGRRGEPAVMAGREGHGVTVDHAGTEHSARSSRSRPARSRSCRVAASGSGSSTRTTAWLRSSSAARSAAGPRP